MAKQIWHVTFEVDDGYCGPWDESMIREFLENAIEGQDGIKPTDISGGLVIEE